MNKYEDCAWVDNIVLPMVRREAVFGQVALCQGDTATVLGSTIGPEPCDGVLVSGDTVVDYRVAPTYSVVLAEQACDSLEWRGTIFTDDFADSETYATVDGCDSMVTVNITVYHSVSDTLNVTENGDSYLWNDSTYTESGTYTVTLSTANGCDSTVTLLLHFAGDDGVATAESLQLSVYPVPTAGLLTVSAPTPILWVEVYDEKGALQAKTLCGDSDTVTLDTQDWSTGLYLLRVATGEGMATVKVVRR